MVKPGVSISPGLECIPGRDGQTDGQIHALSSTCRYSCHA